MLQRALDKEAALEHLEQEERMQRRKEVIELQKAYFQQTEDSRKHEELIERLTQEEAEKQQKMREDQWRREDHSRIALLKDVYNSRAQTIGNKKMWQDEEKWQLDYEKKVLEEELQRANMMHETKVQALQVNKKNHQGDVLKQLNEKDRS